ncbi:hypothetical protein AAFF_G00029570 [Aldrovandia affinis]|uniref:Uncharacterized protein n=1 Tax=Aldrovandia affinis TaxID=143900 RepID=A0AAD7S4B8_9TELE|nr:hypothetical protein AAFF_G00029570 [Aldrovandia affinis]
MVDEMKKRSKDLTLIRQKMELTFSLRRKEIVDVEPMVSEIQERWLALFSEGQNIAVVLEEKIVLTDLRDLPTAFACLFGLLFALNIDYPKELKYTFEVLETIFMELSTNCTQRVRSLKTKLLL